ncbi:TenA family protein [Rothia sp. P7208]
MTSQRWKETVEHRFVHELFAGTIEDQVLRNYLVQDYQFFDAFLSMLGECVACADEASVKLRFARQLGFLAESENTYFEDSFDELGVSEQDRIAPLLTENTSAFEKLMYSAVASQDYAHLLVMLVIAEALYLDWGSLGLPEPERRLHRGWIELHRGEDFAQWAQFLVDELERVLQLRGGADEKIIARWCEAVDREYEFFDENYR